MHYHRVLRLCLSICGIVNRSSEMDKPVSMWFFKRASSKSAESIDIIFNLVFGKVSMEELLA